MTHPMDSVYESSVNEADAKEVKNYYEQRGVRGLNGLLLKKRDEWVDIPIHVAIFGSLGVGKSSFINAIRGLRPEDKNGAVLNSGLTTIEPIPYSHPNKHYLKFWDLPQLDSPAFTKEKYLQNSNFNKYDFFIIIASANFSEADIWFAQQIHAASKRVFFVRSHFDIEATAALESATDSDRREVVGNLMKATKEGLTSSLKQAKLKVDNVFLISTYDIRKFDFPILVHRMIVTLPEGKWEAMALSITLLAEGVIQQKRKALQKRVWIIAIMSMLGDACRVYGLQYEVNMEVVVEEFNEYRRQFSLDDGSVLRLARSIDISMENLKKASAFKTNYSQIADGGLKSNFMTLMQEVSDGITKSFAPVLGSLISGTCAFGSTYYVLNKLLDTMETDALKMIEFVRYRNAEV